MGRAVDATTTTAALHKCVAAGMMSQRVVLGI